MIDQSAIAIGPYPGKNMRRFVIDTYIIFVRVVRSIQILVWNTPLKTNILLKCSLTLTILNIIWISIILLFQFNWDCLYSVIIHVSDVSDDPDGIVACRAQRHLSTKHPEFGLSVAVVDTRGVLRARETTARGVVCKLLINHPYCGRVRYFSENFLSPQNSVLREEINIQ
jgi:hypothetical protein